MEVAFNGRWGTICDYRWDSSDAEVACEELGLESDELFAYGTIPSKRRVLRVSAHARQIIIYDESVYMKTSEICSQTQCMLYICKVDDASFLPVCMESPSTITLVL